MGLLAHRLFNRAAEALELGLLGKPGVHGFLIEAENIGGDEPGRAVRADCKASDPAGECLIGVVRGIGGKIEVSVAPQLYDHTVDLGHIGERGIKRIGRCGHRLLVLFVGRDQRLGLFIVSLKRRGALIDGCEIPFVFAVYIFSFKWHLLSPFNAYYAFDYDARWGAGRADGGIPARP